MPMVRAHAAAKESSIRAVVTRADGTVEDLGLVSYWHRNPIKRWSVNLAIWFRRGLPALLRKAAQ